MFRIAAIAGVCCIAAACLTGCPCEPGNNQLRILNNSNDVLVEVGIRGCFSSGGRIFTDPIFPGENRLIEAEFVDGCVNVTARGDLGGTWEAQTELSCGEIESLALSSDGDVNTVTEPNLIDQILRLILDALLAAG